MASKDFCELHEWRLEDVERRMGRVEKFILGMLILVASSAVTQFVMIRELPSNIKTEMQGAK